MSTCCREILTRAAPISADLSRAGDGAVLGSGSTAAFPDRTRPPSTYPRLETAQAAREITQPTSRHEAPKASRAFTNRSTETDGSAASIFATRD